MNPKIKWLRNQLDTLKLEGMIVTNPVNVRYLTGLDAEGFLILAPKATMFITDSRYIESVNATLTIDDEIIAYDRRELSKYDYEGFFMTCENIGFEENYVTYADYHKYLQLYQVSLVETDGIIEKQRIIKESDEIDLIRKACNITTRAFDKVINNIEEGMTEKDIALMIEKEFIKNGADGLAFDSIVASGPNSSMPHAVPTDRKIEAGDIIQFDIGAKYNGYCADFSRVVFVGNLNEEYKKSYLFVKRQQELLASELKDNANIKTVIKERESEYEVESYDIYHAFGHGVGLEIHEEPVLRDSEDRLLRENTVIAIEPGVYDPGRYGIRIEDTFLVGKNGSEPLTNYSKDIKVINFKQAKTNPVGLDLSKKIVYHIL